MTFDWTITLGTLLTVGSFVASMVTGYFLMQRDVERRFSDVIAKSDDRFNALNIRLEKIFEGDVRELRTRTVVLQEQHDTLMKDMIERSHTANDQLNILVIKVDRLERPKA